MFWIECKSANSKDKISKCVDLVENFEIDPEHTFFLGLDINSVDAETLSIIYGINVVNLENFENKLRETIMHQIDANATIDIGSHVMLDDGLVKKTDKLENHNMPQNEITAYFAKNEIELKAVEAITEIITNTDTIAKVIGGHYSEIAQFLNLVIKAILDGGKAITVPLKHLRQTDSSAICQICTSLDNLGLLVRYEYIKGANMHAEIIPCDSKVLLNFLMGGWYSHYVCHCLQKHLRSFYEKIENLKFGISRYVVLKNSIEQINVDLILWCKNLPILVCTSFNNFDELARKLSNIGRRLGLAKDRLILVVFNISEVEIRRLSSIYSITICDAKGFEKLYTEAISVEDNNLVFKTR